MFRPKRNKLTACGVTGTAINAKSLSNSTEDTGGDGGDEGDIGGKEYSPQAVLAHKRAIVLKR